MTQLTSSQMVEQATGASKDGAVVAFEQTSSVPSLWRLDLGTGASRQLSADALGDFWPSIAGNGERIAFQRALPTPSEGFQFFDARVLVGSSSAGPMTTQVVDEGFAARLSAEGNWLAYFQRTETPSELRLRVKNLATAEGRTLSDRCVLPSVSAISPPIDWIEQTLVWSRSGARVYFVTRGADGHEIRAADLDVRDEPALLTAAPAGARIRDIRLSPSGHALAYLLRSRDEVAKEDVDEVHVWELGGGRPVLLAREKAPASTLFLPGWASDTAVVLIAQSSENGQLSARDHRIRARRPTPHHRGGRGRRHSHGEDRSPTRPLADRAAASAGCRTCSACRCRMVRPASSRPTSPRESRSLASRCWAMMRSYSRATNGSAMSGSYSEIAAGNSNPGQQQIVERSSHENVGTVVE